MKTNRRDFITGSAAMAVGAGAGPAEAGPYMSGAAASAAQGPAFTLNKTPLKLGLMTYLVGQSWDIPSIIKNLTEAKYEHVQLRTSHKHGVEVTLTREQRAEVKQRFLDAGLKTSLACAHQYHDADPAVLRRHIEGTKQFLQLTADVGAQGLRVFPNGVPDEGTPDREKILEQIGRSVSECATTAKGLGVQLRMEEHGNGTSNIPTVRKILDYAKNPDVAIIWNCSQTDTGRGPGLPKGFEGMPIAKQFDLVKGRIGNVHLRELHTDYPWRELFSLLSHSGYQGYCDVEVSPESTEPMRFLHSFRALFLALQNAL